MKAFEAKLRKTKAIWIGHLVLQITSCTLFMTGISLLVLSTYGISHWWSVLIAIIACTVCFLALRSQFPSESDILTLIDRQYPDAEYSASLLRKNVSTTLEELQQERLKSRLLASFPSLSIPVSYRFFWIFVGLLVVVSVLLLAPQLWKSKRSNTPSPIETGINILVESQKDTLILDSVTIKIIPPSYSNLPVSISGSESLSVLKGSRIDMSFSFTGNPGSSWVKFSFGDSLLIGEDGLLSFYPKESGFYSIYFTDSLGMRYASPFYQMRVFDDRPPQITISGLPQYTNVAHQNIDDISFKVQLKDDYGLSKSYVIATITKGSGESIKFREKRIDIARSIGGKEATLACTVPASEFEMEPGNELYFYIAAEDNKVPDPQITKTESYFYIVKDTADLEFSLQGDLGVDVMPEYFRSQLQIILDSRKLIKERKQLKTKEFNKRSNQLAFDQKQLRLKYGQFIGEENESGIAVQEEIPDGADVGKEGENVLSEFGHDHDHENEEGQLMDKGTHQHEHGHDHEGEESTQDTQSPLEDFVHSHEDRETATFYSQSLKSKLRAALNEMWDAELHLRMYDPASSLPYQERAYELIKEIRNHARVYVRRIGFDPPAINEEEARLQKDAEEVYQKAFTTESESKQKYKAIRQLLNKLGSTPAMVNNENTLKSAFELASGEVAQIAIENADNYLDELMVLRNLSMTDKFSATDIHNIQLLKRSLADILLDTHQPPGTRGLNKMDLMESFRQNLFE